MSKIIIFVICIACILLLGLGLLLKKPAAQENTTDRTAQANARSFTLEELSKYDGKNGNPAYIAVNGIVYDVTKERSWKNGKHHGFSAGKDLTADFPHKASLLARVPIVGKLTES